MSPTMEPTRSMTGVCSRSTSAPTSGGRDDAFQKLWRQLAETEGFEPSVREFPVRRFSKPLVSATHPRLRKAASKSGRAAYIGRVPDLQPERQLFPNDLQPHVEAHRFPGIKHAHSKFRPLLFRRVQRGIGVGHRLRDEDAAGLRRIELEEASFGRGHF